jgi:hypothetical protein
MLGRTHFTAWFFMRHGCCSLQVANLKDLPNRRPDRLGGLPLGFDSGEYSTPSNSMIGSTLMVVKGTIQHVIESD